MNANELEALYRQYFTPELKAAYDRHARSEATDLDLIQMATSEAERAMLSTPPHCIPTKGGLPHNEDHANACAHRCWTFLTQLARRTSERVTSRQFQTALDAANCDRDRANNPLHRCAICVPPVSPRR